MRKLCMNSLHYLNKSIVCIFLYIMCNDMKRLLLMLFVLMPMLAFGQAAAERTFNSAVSKMESAIEMTSLSSRKKALNEARSLFRKAMIGFDSQDKKSLCQSKISECDKLLKQKSATTIVPKDDTNNVTADKYFAEAQDFEKRGALDDAIEMYQKASFAYFTEEKKKLCSARIEFCRNPIIISVSELEVGNAAKEYTLTITSIYKEWKVSSDANWVTGFQANTNDTENFIVRVEENVNSLPRGAELTIKCGELYKSLPVTQDGAINIAVADMMFSDKAERQIVTIEAPSDDWTIEAPLWLIVTKLDNGRFSVESETYKSKEPRKGEIKIVCGRNEKVIPVIQVKKGLWKKAREAVGL